MWGKEGEQNPNQTEQVLLLERLDESAETSRGGYGYVCTLFKCAVGGWNLILVYTYFFPSYLDETTSSLICTYWNSFTRIMQTVKTPRFGFEMWKENVRVVNKDTGGSNYPFLSDSNSARSSSVGYFSPHRHFDPWNAERIEAEGLFFGSALLILELKVVV